MPHNIEWIRELSMYSVDGSWIDKQSHAIVTIIVNYVLLVTGKNKQTHTCAHTYTYWLFFLYMKIQIENNNTQACNIENNVCHEQSLFVWSVAQLNIISPVLLRFSMRDFIDFVRKSHYGFLSDVNMYDSYK